MEYGILRLGPTLIPTHSHVYTQGIGRDLLSRAHTLTHAHTHTYTHKHTHTHTAHTQTHTHTNNPEIQKAHRPHVIVTLLGYDADDRTLSLSLSLSHTHTHTHTSTTQIVKASLLCPCVWKCGPCDFSVLHRMAACCILLQRVSVCFSVL